MSVPFNKLRDRGSFGAQYRKNVPVVVATVKGNDTNATNISSFVVCFDVAPIYGTLGTGAKVLVLPGIESELRDNNNV